MILVAVNPIRCFADPCRFRKDKIVITVIGTSMALAVIKIQVLSSLSIDEWFWN
jgi:hypothetical protein